MTLLRISLALLVALSSWTTLTLAATFLVLTARGIDVPTEWLWLLMMSLAVGQLLGGSGGKRR